MTVTTQRRQQPRFASTSRRRTARRTEPAGSIFAASLEASLVGGVSLLLLMLISLIPFQLLALLVIPGFLIVCLATGLLAGVMAGDAIENSYQGGKAGWIAGFWAGVYGGIIAMILAAFGIAVFGIPIVAFGQGVVNQFGPEQLQSMAGYGLTAETIALSGRVFGMLVIVGVIGSLVSALISSVGGMVYPKLSS